MRLCEGGDREILHKLTYRVDWPFGRRPYELMTTYASAKNSLIKKQLEHFTAYLSPTLVVCHAITSLKLLTLTTGNVWSSDRIVTLRCMHMLITNFKIRQARFRFQQVYVFLRLQVEIFAKGNWVTSLLAYLSVSSHVVFLKIAKTVGKSVALDLSTL